MRSPSLTTDAPPPTAAFSLRRLFRLSSFQIGSAMAEILTASIWNRVMIVDLGMPATPVGLLLALQYLLLPLSFWAGHRSDTIPFWGRYRTNYIRLGRGLMVIAFPLLGLSIRRFETGHVTSGWALATLAFLLFGGGKLMSGSVFLALVRDSAPPERRGLAISLVETTLIALFPIAAIGMGRAMERYDALVFWELIAATALIAGFFWWFATVRVEEAGFRPTQRAPRAPLRPTFARIWQDRRTRAFFVFLGSATFFAWMQDNVLEPFGGDVFGLPTGATTRFTGYWGAATVIVTVACFIWRRRQPPEQQNRLAGAGLVFMALGMAALGLTSLIEQEPLIIVGLLLFGVGFGFFTFGGLSLMAVMSPSRDAGAYLGLWTTCVLLSKGVGTFSGGVLRDLFKLVIGLDPHVAYALIFGLGALGLLYAALMALRIDFAGFAREHRHEG